MRRCRHGSRLGTRVGGLLSVTPVRRERVPTPGRLARTVGPLALTGYRVAGAPTPASQRPAPRFRGGARSPARAAAACTRSSRHGPRSRRRSTLTAVLPTRAQVQLRGATDAASRARCVGAASRAVGAGMRALGERRAVPPVVFEQQTAVHHGRTRGMQCVRGLEEEPISHVHERFRRRFLDFSEYTSTTDLGRTTRTNSEAQVEIRLRAASHSYRSSGGRPTATSRRT